MINRYQALAQRIRNECVPLNRAVLQTQRDWHKSKTAEDMDVYLNSAALNLQSFYTGLERLFELIASEVDSAKLGGEHWHVELLRQMTLDLPTARPPVLSQETVDDLDEYRKFRHAIRNVYTTNIVPQKLGELVSPLSALWARVENQLLDFANYLDQLSHADEDV